MGRLVTTRLDAGVAVVTIDRPPANAMDLELLGDLADAVAEAEELDPAAIVLAGRTGFFSAGADLKLFPDLDLTDRRAMAAAIDRAFLAWYTVERPVVCAVTGHAVAGGMVLALCGDYRVGSTEGRLGLTEVRVGIPYPPFAMAVVTAELAAPAVRRLALVADLVQAPEAMALGLLDEVVASEAVLPRAVEVARDLGSMPARAYRATKRALRQAAIASVSPA